MDLQLPSAPPPAVLAQMADALPWPLLLLRRDGALLHANLAGRQLLHRGRTLAIDGRQHVLPTAPEHQPAFSAALRASAPTLLQWPPPSPLPAAQAGCSVILKPLAGERVDGAGEEAAPVLVMFSAAASRHRDLQAFAQMHGFSPAETRVLEHLSLGRSTAGAAAALGVKASTVRSQTTSLRRKSGHASVALLLRALATMPPLAVLHLVQPPRPGAGE